MYKHLIKHWFLILFIAILILPTGIGLAGGITDQESTEKRQPAPFPQLNLSANPKQNQQELKSYTKGLDSFVNDNFTLRNRTIAKRNEYLFYLNDKDSPTSQVIKGGGGHYFGTEPNMLEYTGGKLYEEQELRDFVNELVYRKQLLAKQGIKYYVMVTPIKSTIYSEYIPKSYPYSKDQRLDQLLKYITDNNIDLNIIDPREAVLTAKKDQQMFFFMDSHWNSNAGYIGYTELMNYISKDFPELKPKPKSSFTQTTKQYRGDLASQMGLPFLQETANFYSYTNANIQSSPRMPTEFGPPSIIYRNHTSTTSGGDANLNVVFFRDSFLDAMMPFVTTHFKNGAYPTYHGIDKSIIEETKPQIVIQQIAEHNLINPTILFHKEPQLYDQT